MKKAFLLTALSLALILSLCINSAAASSNIAEGCVYTYEGKTPIASNGGDEDGVKLTDGELAETASLWNATWVVFESKEGNTDSNIIINLGADYDVSEIALNFLIDKDNGASLPVTFKISLGKSKTAMTEVASESYDWSEETGIEEYTKTLDSAVSARYVKLSFTGTSYSWNTYFGIDEVRIYEGESSSETSEPETSKPEASTDESKAETPQTGDMTSIMLVLLLSSISAGLILGARKTKR